MRFSVVVNSSRLLLSVLLLSMTRPAAPETAAAAAAAAATAAAAAAVAACPDGCRCFGERQGERESGSYVDCSWRNATDIPLPIEDLRHSSLLLEGNRITQVDLSFLKHFPALRSLNLAHNTIRALTRTDGLGFDAGDADFDFDPDFDSYSSSLLRPSFSLERVDLSHNHLHVLHAGVLGGGAFPSLRHLNLSANAIHTVAPAAFALPALQTLDMSDNALEEVMTEAEEKRKNAGMASGSLLTFYYYYYCPSGWQTPVRVLSLLVRSGPLRKPPLPSGRRHPGHSHTTVAS